MIGTGSDAVGKASAQLVEALLRVGYGGLAADPASRVHQQTSTEGLTAGANATIREEARRAKLVPHAGPRPKAGRLHASLGLLQVLLPMRMIGMPSRSDLAPVLGRIASFEDGRSPRYAAMAREPLTASNRDAIGRALGALEAVVRLHFRKEEEAYLPLLSRLSAEEASQLTDVLAAGGGGHHHEH